MVAADKSRLNISGQQLVEEMLDAQGSGCPPEYFNIPIPEGHPLFDPNGEGGREIPFLRGRYDARTGHAPNAPREQVRKRDDEHRNLP